MNIYSTVLFYKNEVLKISAKNILVLKISKKKYSNSQKQNIMCVRIDVVSQKGKKRDPND